MTLLPQSFWERLKRIIPAHDWATVQKSFSMPLPITVRINTIKISCAAAAGILKEKNIAFTPIPWCKEALILEGMSSEQIGQEDFIREGYLYRQALSSMIPPLILDPQPNESILDLCAAPGSKTTQIAAQMQNQGNIVAIEAIRPRYYKLKSVVTQMGVTNVSLKLMDARRFRIDQLFDKILLDVPCSTEGRFKTFDPKSFAFWSSRKIKEMARKQKGLLLNAARLLKVGGTLVYSTCTFAPEENEAVIDWLLRKTKKEKEVQSPWHWELAPVKMDHVKTYPAVLEWAGKTFDPSIRHCVRILPDEMMDAFFAAKLIKVKDS